jgi:hypothetical protein
VRKLLRRHGYESVEEARNGLNEYCGECEDVEEGCRKHDAEPEPATPDGKSLGSYDSKAEAVQAMADGKSKSSDLPETQPDADDPEPEGVIEHQYDSDTNTWSWTATCGKSGRAETELLAFSGLKSACKECKRRRHGCWKPTKSKKAARPAAALLEAFT